MTYLARKMVCVDDFLKFLSIFLPFTNRKDSPQKKIPLRKGHKVGPNHAKPSKRQDLRS